MLISLSHKLYKHVFFNFQMCGIFKPLFMVLTSNLIAPWSETMLSQKSVLLTLRRSHLLLALVLGQFLKIISHMCGVWCHPLLLGSSKTTRACLWIELLRFCWTFCQCDHLWLRDTLVPYGPWSWGTHSGGAGIWADPGGRGEFCLMEIGGRPGQKEQHKYWWEKTRKEGQQEAGYGCKDRRPWEGLLLRREAGKSCLRGKPEEDSQRGRRRPLWFALGESGPGVAWLCAEGVLSHAWALEREGTSSLGF